MKTKTKGAATAPDYVVTLAGEDYALIPSIQAVRGLNTAFGGLAPALEAVRALNYDSLARIVAVGAQARLKNREVEALGEALWALPAAERGEVLGTVADYLVVLLNGGRPVEPGDDGGNGDEPDDETDGAAASGERAAP